MDLLKLMVNFTSLMDEEAETEGDKKGEDVYVSSLEEPVFYNIMLEEPDSQNVAIKRP